MRRYLAIFPVASIECLYDDAKTRGLNLEDTGIRSYEKLSDCWSSSDL